MHGRDKVVLEAYIDRMNQLKHGEEPLTKEQFQHPMGSFRFKREIRSGYYTYRFYEAFDGDGPPSTIITGWEESVIREEAFPSNPVFMLHEFDSIIMILINHVEENFKEVRV